MSELPCWLACREPDHRAASRAFPRAAPRGPDVTRRRAQGDVAAIPQLAFCAPGRRWPDRVVRRLHAVPRRSPRRRWAGTEVDSNGW